MSSMTEYLNFDTDTYEDRPSREEGHGKACLANAMISAIQNWRDSEGMTDHEFRLMAQDGTFLATADDYLNESQLSDCLCQPRVREERHYFTIYYFTGGAEGPTSTVHFCSLSDAIAEAEEGAFLGGYRTSAVAREFYGDGEEYVWMSVDFVKAFN